MKARVPKAFYELTCADQARVNKYMQDIATTAALEQINKDCRIMLDLYIIKRTTNGKNNAMRVNTVIGYSKRVVGYFNGYYIKFTI